MLLLTVNTLKWKLWELIVGTSLASSKMSCADAYLGDDISCISPSDPRLTSEHDRVRSPAELRMAPCNEFWMLIHYLCILMLGGANSP